MIGKILGWATAAIGLLIAIVSAIQMVEFLRSDKPVNYRYVLVGMQGVFLVGGVLLIVFGLRRTKTRKND